MPHFENIDQYEAKNPKSGQKEIVPIAPHSMQALDYRLTKSKHSKASRKDPKSAFASVEFDPISVRQMEKEFKQAARAEARRRPRPSLRSRLKKLRTFIASLFGKKPEKPVRRNRPQHRKPGPRPARKSGKQETKSSEGNQNRNRRSRKRRPPNRSQGGGRPEGKQSGQTDGQKDHSQGKKRANRSRRGRRPPNRQNKHSGNDNRNPKSGN